MGQAPVETPKAWPQSDRLASGKSARRGGVAPFPLWITAGMPYLTASRPVKVPV